MITFKSVLSDKETKQITSLLHELSDVYGDFYITKNNLRLFIKENQNVLFDALKRGDKIAFDDDGMAVICGFSDKADRKYLKILTKDVNRIDGYLKVIAWNLDCDLYVKIKKNNPLKEVLEKSYFRFAGNRGTEILLYRRARKHDTGHSYKNQGADSRHSKV